MGLDDLVRQCLLPGVVLFAICVLFFVIREHRLRRRLSRDSSTLALTPDSLRCRAQSSMHRVGQGAVFLVKLIHHPALSAMLAVEDNRALLAMVASRLEQQSDDFLVARYASDSFLIWAPAAQAWEIPEFAPHILEQLSWPYELRGQPLIVDFRIAAAAYPDHGDGFDELERGVQIALMQMDEDGPHWNVFEPAMLERQRHYQGLEHDLRVALASSSMDQFEIHYQPVFDTRTGNIEGCEALLRWHHPVHGNVSPAIAIELAERTGLIVGLGAWVLDTACARAATWPSHWRLHVNVSVRQMYAEELPTQVAHTLANTRLAPHRLVLEITESLFILQYERHVATLNGLRARGVQVALDDFGAGYSSLTHLRRLPIDWVKVDRGFIAELESDTVSQEVVSALLGMCRALGLMVVAEGIETEAQRDILSRLGCHFMQGFLLGRPVPAHQIRVLASSVS
ncbi:putative bifunctional diguanylate cyclase/phosphodiesterase [Bordetella genomosp. 12]|uniref:Diguanylate cyclase n=1 Tax=Bordetella genomosp. 12 TaxID=463035 RepID=A0A261V9B0_9BORD|nr:GGDEF domain-containing phosphodiesterase [Bordetella genomosp. 12]OZI70766.1 diguanylate cyclase [Bordetella genomosp. 12]